jgi:folate-dependent phosphoribosylglycinamide formyltransferase PurN
MLNVAVLCSKRAPGLDALLQRRRISSVVTTHEVFPCAVPVIAHPIRGRIREKYDGETARLLQGADVILLLGYLYVITEPLLAAFPGRILNIHDADLTLRRADGSPRYPGLHATRDAIFAGERETRSSVHVVTSQVDAGPVMARSAAFPVAPFTHEAAARGENDIVRAYAYAQREWMMRSTWGDLAEGALMRMEMSAEAVA